MSRRADVAAGGEGRGLQVSKDVQQFNVHRELVQVKHLERGRQRDPVCAEIVFPV